MDLTIPGTQFLNGITSNGVDKLYISDLAADQIYQMMSATLPTQHRFSPAANDAPPTWPNGLFFDKINNRLLIVTSDNNSKIAAYDFSTNNYSTLVIRPIFGFDGITLDCQNRIYVTDGFHLLRFIPPLGMSSMPEIVADGFDGSDITYKSKKR